MFGFGKTDVGKLRSQNEDSILVVNETGGYINNIFVVADGMGGHKAGEVASSYAIKFFHEYLKENINDEEILDTLVSAVKYSNEMVFKMACNNDEYFEMGTTFLAVTIKYDRLFISHVGDCRVYIIRNHQIAQVTTDHTYVTEMIKAGAISHEQARNHPDRNIITRALGFENEVIVDGLFCKIVPGDVILLCSDGVYSMLTDKEIFDILDDSCIDTIQKTERLIEYANNKGGKDNISAIVIA